MEDVKDTNITMYLESQIKKRVDVIYPDLVNAVLTKEIFVE